MKIKIIATGKKMPAWVNEGYQEYASRLKQTVQLELVEIPLADRSKKKPISDYKTEEAHQLLRQIKPDQHVIALDVLGKAISTEQLAGQLTHWQNQGYAPCVLIGGPDGLDQSCLQRADATWSLSRLTFPHGLVRVILAEQIYRAWSILQGHPYHKV